VRINRDGVLYSSVYGMPCSVAVDPIEKKPLFHFYPGSRIFSLATVGCNLRCLNCQNWEISQAFPESVPVHQLSPEVVVSLAKQERTDSIAFTYTEPTVYFEYMLETARLAKKQGLKTVLVSNGYIRPEPLLELSEWIDAANIDLKGASDSVYRRLTGGHLQPVLDTLHFLRERKVWLEITHLLVPGYTDDAPSVDALCDWLSQQGFRDTPLHFSRFFPRYQLKDAVPTSAQSLSYAVNVARSRGVTYVYTGNVSGIHGEDTVCPGCGKILIERAGYALPQVHLVEGTCPQCGRKIEGRFD
jgi:pyruvate formate lyase activating enzyme